MGQVIQGDCLAVLPTLEAESVDLVCTDPPYGISFMGQSWDKALPNPAIWRECLRVLKPGGFAFIMALPRMYHRLAVAVEDAGFIVHTPLAWAFASGFPKAQDVGKTIDRMAGMEREVIGVKADPRWLSPRSNSPHRMNWLKGQEGGHGKDHPAAQVLAPATPLARDRDGWKVGNSCLKPAWEAVGWFQKPPSERTLVANVLKHGVGAINARAGAIPSQQPISTHHFEGNHAFDQGRGVQDYHEHEGRFPANLIVEDDVLDDGKEHPSATNEPHAPPSMFLRDGPRKWWSSGDSGSFSRYFSLDAWMDKFVANLPPSVQRTFPFLIVPKAGKKERDSGLRQAEGNRAPVFGRENYPDGSKRPHFWQRNDHNTVKPLKLMLWLITLATRPGYTVLDPFMGTGTTLMACKALGREGIGVEIDPRWCDVARARIAAVQEAALPLPEEKP